MAWTAPTWGGIDFGFANSDSDDLRAFWHVVPGNVEQARADFAFPGADGVWTQQLGTREQVIAWDVEVIFKDFDTLSAWEQNILEAQREGKTYEMTALGWTHPACELRHFGPGLLPPMAVNSPWIGYRSYRLVFVNHLP